jgi:putative transposase
LHVVNRGNDRRKLFGSSQDYGSFLGLMAAARGRTGLRLLAYVLMPNHWHLVAWPETVEQLSQFMQRLTAAHAAIVRSRTRTVGQGHVYQGRYHSTVIGSEQQLFHTLRYVEANAVRARLVARAEDWPWSSLEERIGQPRLIDESPVTLPPVARWIELLNSPVAPSLLPEPPRRPRRGIADTVHSATVPPAGPLRGGSREM